MSNEIYGFAEFYSKPKLSFQDLVSNLENSSGLGVTLINKNELFNFPPTYEPSEDAMVFRVSDGPGIKNAEIFIGGLDFAPEADIGLPHLSKDRIDMIINLFDSLFIDYKVSRLCIALVQCNDIEDIVMTDISGLRKTILDQYELLFPPCCLLDIKSN